LLETLKAYEGTVIFVSHDRDFMEALSSKTLELSPGQHKLFYGNYAYYLDKLEREQNGQDDIPSSNQKKESDKLQDTIFDAAEFRESEKKRQAQQRRLQREEEQILKELETLEQEKQKLTEEIQKPEVYSNGEKSKAVQAQIDIVSVKIDAAGERWEKIVTELEES
jgi:ATP-binding cassette subfamily F protein 3